MSNIAAVFQAKIEELRQIHIKRSERIHAAYSEKNNKLEPNVDCYGRLHAPVDGYEDVDGRGIYAKGEFLPVPEDWFDPWMKNPTRGFVYKKRVKVSTNQLRDLREAAGEMILVTSGSTWVSRDVEMCYAYMQGHKPLVDCVVDFFEGEAKSILESRRAADKAEKGEAPTGRVSVKGTITMIRTQQGFGYGQVDYKMFVVLENKSTVYGTLPAFLKDKVAGDEIEFTATFTPSPDDNTHSFYKRPTK